MCDREQYEAAIPKCCAHQTMEAHESIMLCWGLARAVEEGREMNCDNCTENTMRRTADAMTANAALRGAEPASSAERPLEGTVMRKEEEC